MLEWNDLTKRKKHLVVHQQIQCVLKDFDLEILEKFNCKPIIGFTPIAQKENCTCLDQYPHCSRLHSPARTEEAEERINKIRWRTLCVLFSIHSRKYFLDSSLCCSFRWILFWTDRSEKETNQHLPFYGCCKWETKLMLTK